MHPTKESEREEGREREGQTDCQEVISERKKPTNGNVKVELSIGTKSVKKMDGNGGVVLSGRR